MKIRQLYNQDWKLWKEIRLEALKNSPENFASSFEEEEKWPDADFHNGLSQGYILGAFIDDLLVSCAGFYSINELKTKHRGVLWGMYTRPEHREKGIATKLIQVLIQHAKPCVTQLHLTCVTSNDAAKAFYQKQGFQIYGIEPKALKINDTFYDEYLMVLDFNKESIKKPNIELTIRKFTKNDIPLIVERFATHQWFKPISTFEKYLEEQQQGIRDVWLAFDKTEFAGYVTLTKESLYPPFKKDHIPEIVDLNVLPPFRNKGIGALLIETAEHEAFKTNHTVGIGVGLYKDYGQAQKIYIARGYQPDGLGITYNYQPIEPGKMVCLDDDLVLWFTKFQKKVVGTHQ